MKLRYAMLMGVTLLAKTGFSQEEPAKIELFGEYSYLRFNPTLPGLQSRSFNGGGGGATFFFSDHFGIKGELMGYGSTTWTDTFQSQLVVTPAWHYRNHSRGNILSQWRYVHLSVRSCRQSPLA